MRALAVVLLFTSVASADGRIEFHVPKGWSLDEAGAKAADFDFVADDERGGVRMLAKIMNEDAAVSDAGAAGFMKGVQSKAPESREVRHDFPEVAGRKTLRVLFDQPGDAQTVHFVVYMVPAGGQTALIMFASGDDVAPRLGDFDAIVATTTLPPPAPSRSYRLGYATGQILGTLAMVGLIAFFIVRVSRKRAA